jgi:DNA-binding Lrp family transcriptional regulator
MSITRNEAYYSIIEKLPQKRKRIFELLKTYAPTSNYNLSKYTGIPINEITGRINELVKLGVVRTVNIETNKDTLKQNMVFDIVSEKNYTPKLKISRIERQAMLISSIYLLDYNHVLKQLKNA